MALCAVPQVSRRVSFPPPYYLVTEHNGDTDLQVPALPANLRRSYALSRADSDVTDVPLTCH